MEADRPPYMKLTLKTEVSFAKELKPKFSNNVTEVAQGLFFTRLTAEDKIVSRFNRFLV